MAQPIARSAEVRWNMSREAYAREHGLSAPAMAAAVDRKRKLADLHNVNWLDYSATFCPTYYYTQEELGFMLIPKGILSGPCKYGHNPMLEVPYGSFCVKGATTHRDYCGNPPDHGREIDRFEFSDLGKLATHCAKASEIVSKWPAWKHNILQDSSKAQWDTPRTYKDYEEVIKQGYPVAIPNMLAGRTLNLRLPKTEYYFNRAMAISEEIKQGKDPEGFYK